MATTYTPNFNLGKQEDLLDRFDMGVITLNMDIIDEAIYDNATAIEENTADIEQNTSDILKSEKAIKINRRTLGVQATKNVLKTNRINRTRNGITAITNDDGSIHVTGTSTDLTYFGLYSGFTVPESAYYVLSGCPTGGGSSRYQLYLIGDTEMYDRGAGATGYIDASHEMSVYIFIDENETVDLMFYPMLRNADVTDGTYEPYVPSLQEQINALVEEIAELKAQITTTE